MLKFIIISLISCLTTFVVVFVFSKEISKRPLKINNYRIHHSVGGILLFFMGMFISNLVISAIGLGIYLSHTIEEVYFNELNPLRALLIFITRWK